MTASWPRSSKRVLFAALAGSAALHGAALVWAWNDPEPPVRKRSSQELVLTTLRARLAPPAAQSSAPPLGALGVPSRAETAPKTQPEPAFDKRVTGPLDDPLADFQGPAPAANPQSHAIDPQGPVSATERAFAQEVEWPDFAPLGPGSFEVELAFDRQGAVVSARVISSSFDPATTDQLLALLWTAKAPKAGSVALEFTIDPLPPDLR
jgi:hypothetical protein